MPVGQPSVLSRAEFDEAVAMLMRDGHSRADAIRLLGSPEVVENSDDPRLRGTIRAEPGDLV